MEACKFDPLERLAKLRTMFFPDGQSLGQRTMPIISQAADPQFGKFQRTLVGGWVECIRDPSHCW